MTIPRTLVRCSVIGMLVAGVSCLTAVVCHAQSSAGDEFAEHRVDTEAFFRERVTPFITTYCLGCHSNKRPTEGGINFNPALRDPGDAAFSQVWRKAVARVRAHDMPPAFADEQPTAEDRQMFSDWLAMLKYLSSQDPGPFVIRRLTRTEYGNTLRDLFGVDPAIADALPEEVTGEGYLNSLSTLQMEQYLAIADEVLDRALAPDSGAPTEWREQLMREPPALESDARAAARSVARSVARRAYRRPPTEAELEVLLDVFDLGRQSQLSYLESVRLMMKAMLVSPQFLFITPAGEIEADVEIVPLDDYQLASRLSYLLWTTMPDGELMTLADRGKLHERPTLEAQVTRMLSDPRSRALFDGFGAQWLGLGDLQQRIFDPDIFPEMTEEMRAAMYEEVRLVFESVVRENRNVVDLIECDYTFLNETLASIYGLENTITGQAMRRVQLVDRNRGGILGMPGVLAATSFPNRTSPVKRGVWVLQQVLGDNVPSAPPDVPALEIQDEQTVTTLTLRERTELHRRDPVCANCHTILDPIGFGLENFDAIGRWRDQDENGETIDASGELPGGASFSNPGDLKSLIADRNDAFTRNLVEKLLAYALCRRLEGYDEIVVDGLMQDIARDEYRMQTLIRAVVTSYPFTHRRVREERTSNE